jgi:hypothetical protein
MPQPVAKICARGCGVVSHYLLNDGRVPTHAPVTLASISRIQSASANATSVAISTPTTGDLQIVFAYRTALTAPTQATGYTTINTASASTSSFRCGYKVSDGTETTSGTWTNATSVACIVYRGCKVAGTWQTPIGNSSNNSGTTTALSYPFAGPQRLDGTSWFVGFAGISSSQTWTAPSGMTTQTSTVNVLGADTNGGVTAWPTTAVTATASGNWKIAVVELVDNTSSDTDIVFDKTTLGTAVTSGTSSTVAHTPLNNLPNAVVVVIAWFVDGATITGGATWNGSAMTQVWNARETILNQKGIACWIFPVGTGDGVGHNAVVTYGFTPTNGFNMAVLTLGNVDQSTMFRTATGANFDSTNNVPAVTVTAANAVAGDIVIDSLGMGEHANDVSGTALYQVCPDIAGNNFVAEISMKKAAGSTAMSYTIGAAEAIGRMQVAPLIKASASGPTAAQLAGMFGTSFADSARGPASVVGY